MDNHQIRFSQHSIEVQLSITVALQSRIDRFELVKKGDPGVSH